MHHRPRDLTRCKPEFCEVGGLETEQLPYVASIRRHDCSLGRQPHRLEHWRHLPKAPAWHGLGDSRSAIVYGEMRGGELIKEARRRAGISQRELAQRLSTTQSVVARWESGATGPSFETVVRAVRACGFELDVHLLPLDEGFEHDWSLAAENLSRTPEERLANHTAAHDFAERLQRGRRASRARSSG
jgi:transcriptional regulator with XRE-family HTH domain